MLKGQKGKRGTRRYHKESNYRKQQPTLRLWKQKNSCQSLRSSEEGRRGAGTQTLVQGVVAGLEMVPQRHELVTSRNWDPCFWGQEKAGSWCTNHNLETGTCRCWNLLLLIKWSGVAGWCWTLEEQSLLLQPCSLSPAPLWAASNRGSWRSRHVCSVPGTAARSLELRSDGLVACTLLSSEWQGFYCVILFPWMMFIVSFIGISGGRWAQELLNLSGHVHPRCS